MDALHSEKVLSYFEPRNYFSRDYVCVEVTYQPTQSGQFWSAGTRFTISIQSPSQNEFCDTNRIFFQMNFISVVFPPAAVWNNPAPPGNADATPCGNTNACESALFAATAVDAAVCYPGTPKWGFPFFSSVNVVIPGLALQSFCVANKDSQWMMATRLLCSAGTGYYDPQIGRVDFGISGMAELAGARRVSSRMAAVYSTGVMTDRNPNSTVIAAPTDGTHGQWWKANYGARPVNTRGHPIAYQIPVAAFCYLFNQTSCLMPFGFMTTASDSCNFNFECAPTRDVVVYLAGERTDCVGPQYYYVINPQISMTKIQINNALILAAVENLFRGTASIPIVPGIEIPLNMTLKMIDYLQASTYIASAAGGGPQSFVLTMPANQPSCRAIIIRPTALACNYTGQTVQSHSGGNHGPVAFTGDSQKQIDEGQWSGVYGFSVRPVFNNFTLRIASYRVPLDPLFDFTLPAGNSFPLPPGSNATGTMDGIASLNSGLSAVDGATTPATVTALASSMRVEVSDMEFGRMFIKGRHLFSMFASEEHPHTNPLSPFFMETVEHPLAAPAVVLLRGNHFVPPDMSVNPITGIGEANFALAPTQWSGQNWRRCLSGLRNVSGAGSYRFACTWGDTPANEGLVSSNAGSGSTFGVGGAEVGLSRLPIGHYMNPNLFMLPFETFPQVFNHREDAFANRGLDLRSISTIEISATIVGWDTGYSVGNTGNPVDTGGSRDWTTSAIPGGAIANVNVVGGGFDNDHLGWRRETYGIPLPPSVGGAAGTVGWASPTRAEGDAMTVGSWQIRAYMAFDHMMILLPGRIDPDAQFSLIGTGATAIPAGGAAPL